MTTAIPHILVNAVTYHETGRRTVEITCPRCALPHQHDWAVGQSTIGYRVGKCGLGYWVDIPSWAFDSRYRTGYAKYPVDQPHSLISDDDRDDNAMHEYVNIFEE